jgi:hypothetical protein
MSWNTCSRRYLLVLLRMCRRILKLWYHTPIMLGSWVSSRALSFSIPPRSTYHPQTYSITHNPKVRRTTMMLSMIPLNLIQKIKTIRDYLNRIHKFGQWQYIYIIFITSFWYQWWTYASNWSTSTFDPSIYQSTHHLSLYHGQLLFSLNTLTIFEERPTRRPRKSEHTLARFIGIAASHLAAPS